MKIKTQKIKIQTQKWVWVWKFCTIREIIYFLLNFLWCFRPLTNNEAFVFLEDSHTQRNVFEILSNQPEIRLYIPFSDWFGTADGQQCPFAVSNQSENGKYNLISGWFNKIWKRFLCVRGKGSECQGAAAYFIFIPTTWHAGINLPHEMDCSNYGHWYQSKMMPFRKKIMRIALLPLSNAFGTVSSK